MVLRPLYSFFVLYVLLSTCNLGSAVKDLKDKKLTTEKDYDEAKEKIARIESISGILPVVIYRDEENMPSSHVAHHESSYKPSHGGDEAEEKIARIESISGILPVVIYRDEENMPSSHIAHHESSYKPSHGGDEAEEKIARIESISGILPVVIYRDENNMTHLANKYKSGNEVDEAKEKSSAPASSKVREFLHHMNIHEHYDDIRGEDLGVFTVDDVLSFHPGRKINSYFSIRKPDLYPGFLPREIADSIPFSSLEITKILQFFSVSPDSPKGKAIKNTLRMCGLKPSEGETKICATSSESMVEFLKNAFGDVDIKLIGTTHPTMKTPILQSYTVLGDAREIKSPRKVACHPLPYLYAVYMCHYDQISETKVFKVPLVGDNGDKVDALLVCHFDSSNFGHNHPAFSLLKVKPGTPLCHIFSEGHGVWVQSSTPTTSM